MKTEVLLGDEAVALGAIHAGLSAAYSYPGTPASEIMEYLIEAAGKSEFKASWSINEKVAYEEALGVSFAGKRTLVSMKHVGLNVAADPFMNSALTRLQGGLVVVVADDPGMHSSQNEQDSRYYAAFAQVVCFEPSDHQEAYDMTRQAFDISERWHIPVMIRLVTRLSHSRSRVQTQPPKAHNELSLAEGRDWTLLPLNARRRYQALTEIQSDLIQESNASSFNHMDINPNNRSLGIIASGIGYNYVRENLRNDSAPPSLLKISTYPLPETLLKELCQHVDTILVVEDGYPFIEKQLHGLLGIKGKSIRGKLDGSLPITGELQPGLVRKAMEKTPLPLRDIKEATLAARPPQLCQGCSHADTFQALNRALESYPQATVFSDIGCYTLGALPPYKAIDSCVCMGASVSMTKGGADAGIFPAVGVIGDSTFAHSGITPLLDAAVPNTNMVLVIVDNSSVAMTGNQPTFLSGEGLKKCVLGAGVPEEHIRIMIPLPKNFEDNVRILTEEIEHEGISVVISERECVQQMRKRKRKEPS